MILKSLYIIIFVVFTVITGCDKQENQQESKVEITPDATKETCTLENQNKFGPEFAGKCFRSGTYTKSPGLKW
jgi:entry exclusion lipoprotein TrbK